MKNHANIQYENMKSALNIYMICIFYVEYYMKSIIIMMGLYLVSIYYFDDEV